MSQEVIGMEMGMDTKQLEQMVIQVSQTTTLSTHHIGTRSHASDAENKGIFAQHVSPQMYTAPIAEHQTIVLKHAEDTITTIAVHQTATATRATTLHHPQHRQTRMDCSHQQEPVQQYNHPSQTRQSIRIQPTSQQQ